MNSPSFLKNSLAVPAVIMVVYSVNDYFEHILRPGSTFEQHPWYWLAFTAAAVGSFILVTYLCKKALEKIFKTKRLLLEVAAVGVWVALYPSFIGPVIDKYLWPFDDLLWGFKLLPLSIITGGYLLIRVLINLITRKKLLYSN